MRSSGAPSLPSATPSSRVLPSMSVDSRPSRGATPAMQGLGLVHDSSLIDMYMHSNESSPRSSGRLSKPAPWAGV